MKRFSFAAIAASLLLSACTLPGIMTTNKNAYETISTAISKGQPGANFGFDPNNSLKEPGWGNGTIIVVDDARLLEAECHNQTIPAAGKCDAAHTLIFDENGGMQKTPNLQILAPASLFRQPGYANLIMTAITAGIYPNTGTVKDTVSYCNIFNGLWVKQAAHGLTKAEEDVRKKNPAGTCSTRDVAG